MGQSRSTAKEVLGAIKRNAVSFHDSTLHAAEFGEGRARIVISYLNEDAADAFGVRQDCDRLVLEFANVQNVSGWKDARERLENGLTIDCLVSTDSDVRLALFDYLTDNWGGHLCFEGDLCRVTWESDAD